jgi:hypothetical protein
MGFGDFVDDYFHRMFGDTHFHDDSSHALNHRFGVFLPRTFPDVHVDDWHSTSRSADPLRLSQCCLSVQWTARFPFRVLLAKAEEIRIRVGPTGAMDADGPLWRPPGRIKPGTRYHVFLVPSHYTMLHTGRGCPNTAGRRWRKDRIPCPMIARTTPAVIRLTPFPPGRSGPPPLQDHAANQH